MRTCLRFAFFLLFLITLSLFSKPATPSDQLTDSIKQALTQNAKQDLVIPAREEIKAQLNRITGPDRIGMEKMLLRASTWRALVQKAIDKIGLPPGLIAVVMQESAFDPSAVSRTGAGGLWQFKPATGRLFKLRHDAFVDERFDPAASTETALEYLSALHDQFGNWELAMAAYNWGKGSLAKCIEANGGISDFWKLSNLGKIRPETRDYVPAIYARLIVWKNPAKYGFNPVESDPVATFNAPPLSDLEKMERACALSTGSLTKLNPHLLAGCTPPYKSKRGILVSKKAVAKLQKALRDKKSVAFTTTIDKIRTIRKVRHTVKKGESLWGIGQKYNTCMQSLLDFNGWKTAPPLQPGMVVTVYVLKEKSN